jgi:non-heme chloroperoxidase
MAGLLGALRNLGLLGPGMAGDTALHSFVADDGLRIPVRVLGQGAPVVLVHGLGCSHRHWMPVASRLRRRCRVMAWDARGHGACRLEPGSVVTLARLGRDLHQLLDHFELDRPVLVGHSMGALTVMQYLRDHGTSRVAGVAFVDQSPRIVTDEGWRLGLFGGCSTDMLLGLVAGARKNFAETVLHEVEAASGPWLRRQLAPDAAIGRGLRLWLGRLDTAGLVDLAESLTLADFRALLPRLDLPTWVVLGGNSPHYRGVPLDRYYLRAVPHASVMVYQRSGHSPHVAEPGRFAKDLLRFIDDHA